MSSPAAPMNRFESRIDSTKNLEKAMSYPTGGWGVQSTFGQSLAVIQLLTFAGFVWTVRYGGKLSEVNATYPMFQDVHVMMLIGFGALYLYLRKNAFMSVGMNFLLYAVTAQWSLLVLGWFEWFWHTEGDARMHVHLDVDSLVTADFCSAAILISYGAVLGKLTPTQLVWMSVVEAVAFAFNERIIVEEMHVSDVGGSMVIHTFGAFFGLGVTLMVSPRGLKGSDREADNRSVYHSDVFAVIGTLFLFCYWPSFNAALSAAAGPGVQERTVLNTYISLCSSCIATFAVSQALRAGRMEMVDIQNATLAGGVAVGAVANLAIQPWGAMLVGTVAGVVSTAGFARIGEWFHQAGLHDTALVQFLHGWPGLIGCFASAIAAGSVGDESYTDAELNVLFPQRGNGRSRGTQAGYQIGAGALSVGFGLAAGLLTGLVLRQRAIFAQPSEFFSDAAYFHTPGQETPMYFAESSGPRRIETIEEGGAESPGQAASPMNAAHSRREQQQQQQHGIEMAH